MSIEWQNKKKFKPSNYYKSSVVNLRKKFSKEERDSVKIKVSPFKIREKENLNQDDDIIVS